MKFKPTFWRVIFVVIMGLGLYSTFIRFFYGLGAVSNMTDQFPWGLWIGFDLPVWSHAGGRRLLHCRRGLSVQRRDACTVLCARRC